LLIIYINIQEVLFIIKEKGVKICLMTIRR